MHSRLADVPPKPTILLSVPLSMASPVSASHDAPSFVFETLLDVAGPAQLSSISVSQSLAEVVESLVFGQSAHTEAVRRVWKTSGRGTFAIDSVFLVFRRLRRVG